MAFMQSEVGGATQGCRLCVLNGAVSLGAVQRAVTDLVECYQALRCTIAEADGALSFVEAEPIRIPVSLCIAEPGREPPAVQQEFFESELNQPIDASTALWRVALLSGPGPNDVALAISCQHAIVDGPSEAELLSVVARRSMRRSSVPAADLKRGNEIAARVRSALLEYTTPTLDTGARPN